ncbi:MAG TPA: hypothetical protein VIL46_07070 [Gemmataceae bacterium]
MAADRRKNPDPPDADDPPDRHAAGTPGGGSEAGGLAGTNIGSGDPDSADLEEIAGSGVAEEEQQWEREELEVEMPLPDVTAEEEEGEEEGEEEEPE